MTPLKITAHLKCGFTSAFDWSVSIDAIIASQHYQQKFGFEQYVQEQSSGQTCTHTDLPIAKEYFGDDWWYQCSRPLFKEIAIHNKHIHRRFNIQEAERHVNKVGKVETTKGAYKNARLLVPNRITQSVTWFVNGDKSAIEQLLNSVTHIGGRRGSGHGAVSRWEVVEHDSLDDCRLKRILPIDFAQQNGVEGLVLEWGIRPDYKLKENKRLCVIPSNCHD